MDQTFVLGIYTFQIHTLIFICYLISSTENINRQVEDMPWWQIIKSDFIQVPPNLFCANAEIFAHLLLRVFIKVDPLKACQTVYQWLNSLLIRRIRLYPTYFLTDSFLTSHLPFLMTVISKCRSLYPLLFLPLLLAVSVVSRSWLTFGIIFEDFIKMSGKWEGQKIAICYLPESIFHRATGFLFYLWIYAICYL